MAMGDGTLPLESFKGYLIQDYLYLVHFSRANALASYKAKNIEDIVAVRLALFPSLPVSHPFLVPCAPCAPCPPRRWHRERDVPKDQRIQLNLIEEPTD